jgi:hypothetical protein
LKEIQRVRKFEHEALASPYSWIEGGGDEELRVRRLTREEAITEGLIPESEISEGGPNG